MKYNPRIHHRKSIRLKGYDYSQAGLYFITICTQARANVGANVGANGRSPVQSSPVQSSPVQSSPVRIFGEIVGGKMVLNDAGIMVKNEWEKSEIIRDEIKLHEYIVMPNHFHGIVEIVGANGRSPLQQSSPVQSSPVQQSSPSMKSKSIGSLMAGFKSSVTKRINQMRGMPGHKLWQRNYWEHIIRNQNEYQRISEYIINNPINWNLDKLNGGDGNMVMESQTPYGRTAVRPNDEIWMV